jgi:hypothetical protein
MGRLCKLFGHRKGFIEDPYRPNDIIFGCTRCRDPKLQVTICRAEPDPMHPGMLKVQGLEKLRGLLEGMKL